MKSSIQLLEWDELCTVLAGFAQSELGAARALRLRPFTDPGSLGRAMAQVAEAEQVVAAEPDRQPLTGARDLGELVKAANRRGQGLEPLELAQILTTLNIAAQQTRWYASREEFPALRRLTEQFPDLEELRRGLERTVSRDGEILDTAHPDLVRLRAEKSDLEKQIRSLAERISATPQLQSILRPGPAVLRDGRFMLAVKAESRGNLAGVLHDRSASGNTVFIEPEALVRPQNELVDLRGRERQLISRALFERTKEVRQQAGPVHEVVALLGRLDLLFARARFGVQRRYRLLEFDPGQEQLILRQAYHPLLVERERERFVAAPDSLGRAFEGIVPFDLTLGDELDALVVTGPNTGGKTVALKATGLIVLMGLAAIPASIAAGSKLPWFDGVYADVGDEQSLQQNLSTFSGHLLRISHILERASKQSLVLLDELGSGTDPAEGEALSQAVLKHLLARGSKIIATTHLSGLKQIALQSERVENASLEFDAETLKPLFRLTIGLPGESNALTIARRHGIPEAVVQSARQKLSQGLSQEQQEVAEHLSKSRHVVIKKLEQIEDQEREVDRRRTELERKDTELREREGGLEQQKVREIDRLLAELEKEGHALLKELGTVPRSMSGPVSKLRDFFDQLPSRSQLTRRRAAYIQQLRKEEMVYLPRYRENCRVKKIDKARQVLTVVYRAMAMEVPFAEVACPEDFVPAPKEQRHQS